MKLVLSLTIAATTLLLILADDFEDRPKVIEKCQKDSGLEFKKIVLDKTCDIDEIEKDPNYPVYLDCYATTMGFLDKDKNIDKEKLYQYKLEVEGLEQELAQKIADSCSEVDGPPEKKALNLRKCVCKQLN